MLLLLTIVASLCVTIENVQMDIDKNSVTVSGLSAGGAMAAQMHVAFSSTIKGAGIFAGPPYHCANGQLTTATMSCMNGFGSASVANMQSKVQQNEQAGLIDPSINMAAHRVFIFAGTSDFTVSNAVTKQNVPFYEKYIKSSSNIKGIFNIAATHAMITDSYGKGCGVSGSPYIVNCGYNGAYEMFSHLYDETLEKPSITHKQTGDLSQFSQTEFFPAGSAASISMDPAGFIYIPQMCKTGRCRLHVALHGCIQGKDKVGEVYVRNSGYNQVADLNGIIIVYPQAKSSMMSNPNGCWDWWGYSDKDYSNKNGKQMKAIKSIIDEILGN